MLSLPLQRWGTGPEEQTLAPQDLPLHVFTCVCVCVCVCAMCTHFPRLDRKPVEAESTLLWGLVGVAGPEAPQHTARTLSSGVKGQEGCPIVNGAVGTKALRRDEAARAQVPKMWDCLAVREADRQMGAWPEGPPCPQACSQLSPSPRGLDEVTLGQIAGRPMADADVGNCTIWKHKQAPDRCR